jgi:YD repeat-containing protein
MMNSITVRSSCNRLLLNSSDRHRFKSAWFLLTFSVIAMVFTIAASALADTQNYTYDVNGRLVSAGNNDGNLITYSYDGAGNLLSMVSSSSNNTLRVFISPAGSGHVSGSGLSCPSLCTQPYSTSQDVTLTAAGEDGYQFLCWGGGGQTGSANPLTFLLAEDMKLTAYFGATDGQTDTDGVYDEEERGPSGDNMLYDGNNDGIPDYLQANVASLPVSGGGYATLSVPAGLALMNVQNVANPPPDDTPAGLIFPYGFFSFAITGLAPGACTTATLHLPLLAGIDHYYNYGPTSDNTTPHWYSFGTGAQIVHTDNTTTITVAFCDAKRGDDILDTDAQVMSLGGPTRPVVFTVTAEAGANGSITPVTQNVNYGLKTYHSVRPDSGYKASVTGCDGYMNYVTSYVTGPITADCTVRAEFIRQIGSLTVNITPEEAMAVGARWRRKGTDSWLEGGATETDLPIGEYEVEFNELPGMIKPPNLEVNISDLQTTTITRQYVNYNDLCRALNNCNLTWMLGGYQGARNWFPQTTTISCGDSAAEAGGSEARGEDMTAWVETKVTGPGELSFLWKLTREKKLGVYANLAFYVDNVWQAVGYLTDSSDWSEQHYTIPEGEHKLVWKYWQSGGACGGWLDRVLWPGTQKGDLNHDNQVNLGDVVLGLQIIARIAAPEQTHRDVDIDGNGTLGLEEVIYTLQKLAEIR